MRYQTSEKKQKLIDDKNSSPILVGEIVIVNEYLVSEYKSEKDKTRNIDAKVIEVNGDNITVQAIRENGDLQKEVILNKKDIGRGLRHIGANPFPKSSSTVRFVAFTLESILSILGLSGRPQEKYQTKKGYLIKSVNWNPFVINSSGEKKFFQRPFVWTIEDKQLLIESIYQGIDCGKILVRLRGWDEIDKMEEDSRYDISFYDIVDGKQRLKALQEFLNNEYTDSSGNYFGDLSFSAQHKFTNHQLLAYAEMSENTPDEQVLEQFLKLNHTGVPQSKEHMDFVKSINIK